MNTREEQLPREASPRKVRADTIAILAVGACAAAAVVTLAVSKLGSLFRPEGVAWNLPVEPTLVSAQGLRLYSSEGRSPAVTVDGSASRLSVIVPDVNTVSTVCLAISVVLLALTALAVIACIVRIAWMFQRGRFFSRTTSRTLTALTYTGVLGGILAFGAWQLGANGVEAALGVQATHTQGITWWSWYWIVMFAAVSSGLLDIALRRAIRLQRETEGLV